MNDEIKEILESLDKIAKAEYYPEDLLTYKECQLLLDYITNLQEENQRLKNLCDKYEEEHNTTFKLWKMKMEEMPTYEEKIEIQKENEKLKQRSIAGVKVFVSNETYNNYKGTLQEQLEDYKSRCENAQDLILNELSHLKASDEETWNKEFYDENNKLDYRKLCIELLNQVANLLDGGDE